MAEARGSQGRQGLTNSAVLVPPFFESAAGT